MMAEKHERLEQIKDDEEALAKLDATIASHITPNLVRPRCGAVRACAARVQQQRRRRSRLLGRSVERHSVAVGCATLLLKHAP
jgi:hypothetical protein